ncbi:hypothetical protein GTV32_15465 [Gordonia sp. SID5947]|uniref:hypothetical protein n=1 Tax=Gordonia sp. SID5947 TaxID=2690315 RepID=UPI00136D2815|nr:hypothetical protein [Gordonia sp. SID5947]MYR07617.1 hypothetical protein [Gordonia sp. SID5947]
MRRNMIRGIVAGAAAVGAAGLAVPAVATAAPVNAMNCAKVATPTSPNGWGNTFPDERGQAGKVTATKVVDDDGSLEFMTTEQMPRQASYHAAGKLPLVDVAKNPLSFEKSAGNANWQIRVTGANVNSADGFATLVWSAPAGAGKEDASKSNQWWATRDLPGIPKGQNATLEKLTEAANSDSHKTVVDHYGISSQPNDKTGKVNVDNVSFNGCTTNFAATGGAGAFGSLDSLIP